MTYEEIMALAPEDLTEELVQELVQESAIVHYAMTRHWQDGWTLEQSLIYAVAYLVSANFYILRKVEAMPPTAVITAKDGRILAQEFIDYMEGR